VSDGYEVRMAPGSDRTASYQTRWKVEALGLWRRAQRFAPSGAVTVLMRDHSCILMLGW
jgi:hypothetical protein